MNPICLCHLHYLFLCPGGVQVNFPRATPKPKENAIKNINIVIIEPIILTSFTLYLYIYRYSKKISLPL